jgi:hypothetical protein
MRARLILVLGSIAFVGVGLVAQACSSSPAVDASDAGADVIEAEAAVVDAATCDLSANLLDKIPDAEVADGATTTGICIQCTNSKCATQVGACNASCKCQNAAGAGLECYLKDPQNATACIIPFTSGGVDLKVQAIGIQLLGCINTNCKDSCATAKFESDGGGGTTSDGG